MYLEFTRLVWLGLALMISSALFGEFDHSHALWNRVLSDHVQSGFVDYRALSEDTSDLDVYLKQLNFVSRATVDAWPREMQLAFWINAYNALTVRVILDYYPIRTWTFKGLVVPRNSIIQIPGVWDKLTWEVAGQSVTIGHIEHGLLRPNFEEPRIHFAIVCASIGCPDLRPEAYTFDKLEEQLESQTKAFLLNESKGAKLDFEKKRVRVSKLFNWFTEDFIVEPREGVVIRNKSPKGRIALQFISHYRDDPKSLALLQSGDTKVKFLGYDWLLNDIANTDG